MSLLLMEEIVTVLFLDVFGILQLGMAYFTIVSMTIQVLILYVLDYRRIRFFTLIIFRIIIIGKGTHSLVLAVLYHKMNTYLAYSMYRTRNTITLVTIMEVLDYPRTRFS